MTGRRELIAVSLIFLCVCFIALVLRDPPSRGTLEGTLEGLNPGLSFNPWNVGGVPGGAIRGNNNSQYIRDLGRLHKSLVIREAACNRLVTPQQTGASPTTNTLPLCSLSFANDFYLCHEQLNSKGTWAKEHYQPHGCDSTFTSTAGKATGEEIAQLSSLPRDLLLLGDSNGYHYMMYLEKLLQDRYGATCKDVTPHGEFGFDFEVPNQVKGHAPETVHGSRSIVCNVTEEPSSFFNITFLTMEFTLDFELQTREMTNRDLCDFNQSVPCRYAWSSQQFLFQEYLVKVRPWPREIHYFQNIHDCSRRTTVDFRRDLRWLYQLLNDSLPVLDDFGAHDVYLWEALAVYTPKQNPRWVNITSNVCAGNMNAIAAEEARPYVEQSRLKVGFGMHSASLEKAPEWNGDGVHYYQPMYNAVLGFLMQPR